MQNAQTNKHAEEQAEFTHGETQVCYTRHANGNIFDDVDEESSIKSEIALFRAVIMQALTDAVSNSKRTEDKMAKLSALSWFNANSQDFRIVCELANLNFRWVIKKAKTAINNGCKWKKDFSKIDMAA